MPEQLTISANEDRQFDPPPKKAVHTRIARYVSTILAPAPVSLPFVILVALYHSQNIVISLYYACITLFFLSFGPTVYILLGVRQGRLSDVDVSRRSERKGPFLFGIISVSIGLVILVLSHAPKNLQTLLLITDICGVIMLLITLWWKISIHASSLASTVTMLTALYGAILLPTFLLIVLVGWSRVVLRRHTVAQVTTGSLVSIVLVTVILLIRGV